MDIQLEQLHTCVCGTIAVVRDLRTDVHKDGRIHDLSVTHPASVLRRMHASFTREYLHRGVLPPTQLLTSRRSCLTKMMSGANVVCEVSATFIVTGMVHVRTFHPLRPSRAYSCLLGIKVYICMCANSPMMHVPSCTLSRLQMTYKKSDCITNQQTCVVLNSNTHTHHG
jgi:hypothetical protein